MEFYQISGFGRLFQKVKNCIASEGAEVEFKLFEYYKLEGKAGSLNNWILGEVFNSD